MHNRREHLIRGAFSFLAATVTLGMSQEWMTWALEQRQYWKLVPSIILASFAVFEAEKVWGRAEEILNLR